MKNHQISLRTKEYRCWIYLSSFDGDADNYEFRNCVSYLLLPNKT